MCKFIVFVVPSNSPLLTPIGSKMLPLQIIFTYRWREANANAQRAAGIIGMLP
jgi:hypothetical protein